MSLFTTYKSLQVIENAVGNAGQALTNNFKTIADWNTALVLVPTPLVAGAMLYGSDSSTWARSIATDLTFDQANQRLGIGHASPPSALSLPDAVGAAYGIAFGNDVNLYRSVANYLKSDDSLQLNSVATAGRLNFSGTVAGVAEGISWGDNANLYRSSANTLTTDGNLSIAGNLSVSGNFTNDINFSIGSHSVHVSGGDLTVSADTGYVRLGAAGLKFPNSDTTVAGAVLATDAAGQLYFRSFPASQDARLPNSTVVGEILYGVGDNNWSAAGSTARYISGKLVLNSDTTTGRVNFNTSGTTSADGLYWGDVSIYRSGVSTLTVTGAVSGVGNITFLAGARSITAASGDLTITAGTNSVKIGAATLKFPNSDSTSGALLSTDGSGQLVWTRVVSGGGSVPASTVNGELLYGSSGAWVATGSTARYVGGNLILNSDTTRGRINFNTSGTTVADGLCWGDLCVYRNATSSLYIDGSLGVGSTQNGATTKLATDITHNTTSNGTTSTAGLMIRVGENVNQSITNSGSLYGINLFAYRNYLTGTVPDSAGTLTTLAGLNLQFGHSNETATSAPTTTSAYGAYLNPVVSTGTITDLYGIRMAVKSGSGTATRIWPLYLDQTDGHSYFGGNLGIGQSTYANITSRLSLPQGTTVTDGISWVDSANLYRSDSNMLRMDGSLQVLAATGTVGALNLPTTGTAIAQGISWGDSANLYRSAANILKVDGSLQLGTDSTGGRLNFSATGTTLADGINWGDGANLYRSAANMLKADGSLQLASTATTGRLNFSTTGTTVANGISWGDSANLYRSESDVLHIDGKLQLNSDSTAGRLNFSYAGTTMGDGISWGSNANLYRSVANVLKSDGSLQLSSTGTSGRLNLSTSGNTVADGISWGGGSNLYRSGVNAVRMDGDFWVGTINQDSTSINYFGGNVGFGTTSNVNSRITFPTSTNAADGILWGDVNLYRSGANVLKTDDSLTLGGNTLSFTGQSAYTISGDTSITISTTAGNVKLGTIGHAWPNSDGSSGQVLSTNGAGVLSWATASSGGGGGSALIVQDSGSYTVLGTTADIGKCFKNGSSGLCTYNLPTAASNLNYIFMCDNGEIRVVPGSGDKIRLFNAITLSGDSGGYISATDVCSVVQLVAIDATNWVATYITGIWSV